MLRPAEMRGLPPTRCLVVAASTPVGVDLRPDKSRLIAHIDQLLGQGCDGVVVFGTTGEGAAFSVEDRMATLNAVISAGIDPQKIIVSVGALPVPDVVRLTRQATDQGVHGVLLMPPCAFRAGIGEDGTFHFFKAMIDGTDRPHLQLYLYHFPGISGVPVTPNVIRRLDERYPGTIAGVKDSGGDQGYTEMLVRRFSHLSIFTGEETHVPDLLATGLRGTVCGLANVMPRLLRVMMDLPSAYDRRQLLQTILVGDVILSRRPFIPSVKAIIAASLDDPEWRRVSPPMSEVPVIERERLVADYFRWEAGLPRDCQSLRRAAPLVSDNVVAIRHA